MKEEKEVKKELIEAMEEHIEIQKEYEALPSHLKNDPRLKGLFGEITKLDIGKMELIKKYLEEGDSIQE